MLKALADLVKQVLTLARDTTELKGQVKDLQQQIRDLSKQVELLAFEVQRIKENEVHEHEKMALRLENVLLRFEPRLPPARQDSNQESDKL